MLFQPRTRSDRTPSQVRREVDFTDFSAAHLLAVPVRSGHGSSTGLMALFFSSLANRYLRYESCELKGATVFFQNLTVHETEAGWIPSPIPFEVRQAIVHIKYTDHYRLQSVSMAVSARRSCAATLFDICNCHPSISVRCAEQNGSTLGERMWFEIGINSLSGRRLPALAPLLFLKFFFVLDYITQV
jgi:hypothetical protein